MPRCPELDCVRHLLTPAAIAFAELRAAELGIGADRILIARGLLSEEAYLAALGAALRIAVEPLERTPRAACPLADHDLIEAAVTGIIPLNSGGEPQLVIAPSLVDSRRLVGAVQPGSDLARHLRITSAARMQQFIARHATTELARRAVLALRQVRPDLSAGTRRPWPWGLAVVVVAAALSVLAVPDHALLALELSLGLIFVSWTGLRLLGIASDGPARARTRAIPDDRLPIYTIIVALYREAAGVGDLVAALRRIDYPPEKLDIKLVLEPDDRETCAALESLRLKAPFEIVIAPNAGPRTKPKALNVALAFARGSFVAIYDAEDRPDPNQIRRALDAFVAGDERLACVQARLTIDNTADSWLARLFTAEYAGLFDVFLPSLAAWRLPLPLGGSSNHFRTAVLRRIGAWDPYNVTEDADLGMRLARLGYRTTVIASSTYEEAPARFAPWLKQRTRWFKGWMQTWLVHMRSPGRLVRELGLRSFIVFQLLVGGTVLAALVHAVFAIELAFDLIRDNVRDTTNLPLGLHAATLVVGYATSATLAVIGLSRRRLLGCGWALLLMPVYWLLLSLAAWRALFQLICDPYRWEKTEHGLARTSRLAERSAGPAPGSSIRSSDAGRPHPLAPDA